MENHNGLVVAAEMTAATGTAEREAAVAMVEELADGGRVTSRLLARTGFWRHQRRHELGHLPDDRARVLSGVGRSHVDGNRERHSSVIPTGNRAPGA
jgi:hypothetical protein